MRQTKPIGIALRVMVALGVLLAPAGAEPHVVRRLTELFTGQSLSPWGWLQIAFHLGVPLLLLTQAVGGIRRARTPDIDDRN